VRARTRVDGDRTLVRGERVLAAPLRCAPLAFGVLAPRLGIRRQHARDAHLGLRRGFAGILAELLANAIGDPIERVEDLGLRVRSLAGREERLVARRIDRA